MNYFVPHNLWDFGGWFLVRPPAFFAQANRHKTLEIPKAHLIVNQIGSEPTHGSDWNPCSGQKNVPRDKSQPTFLRLRSRERGKARNAWMSAFRVTIWTDASPTHQNRGIKIYFEVTPSGDSLRRWLTHRFTFCAWNWNNHRFGMEMLLVAMLALMIPAVQTSNPADISAIAKLCVWITGRREWVCLAAASELMVSRTAFTISHSSGDLIMIEAIWTLAERSRANKRKPRKHFDCLAEIKKCFVGRANWNHYFVWYESIVGEKALDERSQLRHIDFGFLSIANPAHIDLHI